MRLMRFLLVVVGVVVPCVAFRECGGENAEFNKMHSMHRLLICLMMGDCEQSEIGPEMMVILTKKLAQRTPQKFHRFYHCGWKELKKLPIDFQVAVNRSRIFTSPFGSGCLSRDKVCENHKQFVYPIICMLQEKCDSRMSKIAYAFLYSMDQLNVESERPLSCDGTDRFDVDQSTIFHIDFCEHIPSIDFTAGMWSNNFEDELVD
ncbi:hypothetical protein M3Y94_01184700 [Aphelenchoides besseyi]|nr:hypothetical protein M3Y94_01184700 [Aphelenchoides besseyi]